MRIFSTKLTKIIKFFSVTEPNQIIYNKLKRLKTASKPSLHHATTPLHHKHHNSTPPPLHYTTTNAPTRQLHLHLNQTAKQHNSKRFQSTSQNTSINTKNCNYRRQLPNRKQLATKNDIFRGTQNLINFVQPNIT